MSDALADRPSVSPAAVLPAPPPVLPPWGKVLWFIANTVASGVAYQAYQYAQEITASGGVAGGPDPTTWRKFVYTWENMTSLDSADDQVLQLEFVNYTNGAPDSSWTQTDFDQVVNYLDTALIVPITAQVSSNFHCTRVESYRRAFNDYSNVKPFADSGPPEYMRSILHTGGLTSTVAPQGTTTITEMTANRRHWGRFYVPTLGVQAYATTGRLEIAVVDALATAAANAVEGLAAVGFHLVVPTTQVDKQANRLLQTVSGVRVDDVPDVIRRRRFKNPAHTHSLPV